MPIKIRYYRTRDGKEPFTKWLDSLKDQQAINRIIVRIDRLENGNLGDYDNVGKGVIELRDHYGPGYRLYCGRDGKTIIIMLCGGDKSTQKKDIKKAKEYWDDYNS